MIGWYVHGQGRGHLTRLQCIAPHLTVPVAGLSVLPEPSGWAGRWVRLAPDHDGLAVDPTAGGVLHWAPRHHPGMRARGAAVAVWAQQTAPDLVVVDVSVEMTLLVRLLGIPVVVVGMRGARLDRAHRAAYDLAEAILCPWPADFPEPTWPTSWHEKAWYVGALSRLDGIEPTPGIPRRIALLWGEGGGAVDERQLAFAQKTTPDWAWEVVRESTAAGVSRALAEAEVVVTHAGQSALSEVAAFRRPAVVLPQRRPFGEQQATADALRCGAIAVVCDEWPADWPQALTEACVLGGGGWQRWSDGHGAQRAAAHLDRLAGELCAQR